MGTLSICAVTPEADRNLTAVDPVSTLANPMSTNFAQQHHHHHI
jgi:hypothetical protein